MTNTVIDVSHVTVNFNDHCALDDVSFNVPEHEVAVILGPNGAGKSTLLKAILHLIPFRGKTIISKSQKLAYLPPQETILKKNLPPLTVADFFTFKKVSRTRVMQLLEQMGLLPEILKHQFASLSTGQFQRMMLAWALVDNPSILVLDEPLNGIDVSGQEQIYSLLHHMWINDPHLTILLVSHNLHIIWKHATKVLCLNQKLIHSGTPESSLTPDILKKTYNMDIEFYEHHHRTS